MDVTSVSNSDLDNAWYAAYQVGDQSAMQFYGAEIVRRMASLSGFFSNLLYTPFPHYEAATNFTTAASDSIGQAVTNLPANIGSGIGAIVTPVTGALKWPLIVVGVLLVVVVVVKLKK